MSDVAEVASLSELKEKVATSCRVLFKIRLADYMGHASARIPGTDRVLIKPRHSESIRGLSGIRAEHIATVNLDGDYLDGPDKPPSERFIHTGIYRVRSDVGGIVHTHQTLATLFGIVGRPILPIIHVEAPLVARPVPIYPSPELIDTVELGDAIAAALGNHTVLHLQGHGIVTVGSTVEEATVNAIHLERLARANYMTAQLGDPRVITPDEIDRLVGPMVGYRVRWAYYASLADEPGPVTNW